MMSPIQADPKAFGLERNHILPVEFIRTLKILEDNMKTLLISAVSLFLSLGGAAVAQTTVVVPGEVKTYVEKQDTPSVTFEGDVAVGTALPDTVEIHTIPDQPDYGYVVVNKKRVLVNPKTRTVIEVIK